MHPAFYSSSRMTLNVTRRAMADMGYCPSGRLFEAAACGVPLLSDEWEGLDEFYTPGSEILLCHTPRTCCTRWISRIEELKRIAAAARERTLAEHTADTPCRRTRSDSGGQHMWGIIPAAGKGSRIQPLAFSKELLPVGSRYDGQTERPLAVSEYLVERMIAGGANKICFVISPGKSDILEYYGGKAYSADRLLHRAAAARRTLRCDLSRAAVHRRRRARSGRTAGHGLVPGGRLQPTSTTALCRSCCFRWSGRSSSMRLSPTSRARARDPGEAAATPQQWIWGAFKMPAAIFAICTDLWLEREPQDEYFGTLVNA